MAPTSIRPPRRPAPPEIPDEYALTAQWRSGPASAPIAVEVYGRRRHRDAIIRIIDDAGSLDSGTVTAGGTQQELILWKAAAIQEFGEDWLHAQGQVLSKFLMHRWNAS
jgi:hypothetical protein